MAKGNKSVSAEEVEALLARAAKAGAKEEDVAGMRQAITENPSTYEEILAAVEGAESPEEFFVTGPGSINFNGQVYLAGEPIRLTKQERDALGEAVTSEPSTKKTAASEESPDGVYSVTGGSVNHDGVVYEKGQTLFLTAEQAKRLPNVEPV